MAERLHFTDEALAQLADLGLDQEPVRTAIAAGTKAQVAENRLLVRHRDLEVEVATLGADYEVRAVRREAPWPRGRPTLPYLRHLGDGGEA